MEIKKFDQQGVTLLMSDLDENFWKSVGGGIRVELSGPRVVEIVEVSGVGAELERGLIENLSALYHIEMTAAVEKAVEQALAAKKADPVAMPLFEDDDEEESPESFGQGRPYDALDPNANYYRKGVLESHKVVLVYQDLAARLLGVLGPTLSDWTQLPGFPVYKPGGHNPRYFVPHVRRWMKANGKSPSLSLVPPPGNPSDSPELGGDS